MKTSYLTHTLIALILATLASCGGKNQTSGQRATPTPQQTQDEREALDSAIENSRISRELLGAKASERHSFEMEYSEVDGVRSIYLFGQSLELNEEIASVLMAKLQNPEDRLYIRIDELVVSAKLTLPSVKVELVGESLTFISDGAFDVSGDQGNDAGEIILEYEKVEDQGDIKSKRFLLHGGEGIPSQGGSKGIDGHSVPALSGDVVFRRTVRIECPVNHERDFSRFKARECYEYPSEEGVRSCPGNGSSAIAPSEPGRGGRRGSFQSAKGIGASIAAMIEARDGSNAPASQAFLGGMPGTPVNAKFEYVLIKNNGSREVRHESCPTTHKGSDIASTTSSSAEREALPWGVRTTDLNSISFLKKMESDLRFNSQLLTAYDLDLSIKILTRGLSQLELFKAENEELAYKGENLLQQFQVAKVMNHFIRKYGFLGDAWEASRSIETAKKFLSIKDQERATELLHHFGMHGLRQGVELARSDLSKVEAGLKFEIMDFLSLFSTNDREFFEFNSNDQIIKQSSFADFWLENSLDSDLLLKHLELVESDDKTAPVEVYWPLLLAYKAKLERNHLFYLSTFASEVSLERAMEAVVRWDLMLNAQRVGSTALEQGRELHEDFIQDFDLKLVKAKELNGTLYDNYQLQSAASQLLAPIYRYAQ